MWELLRDNIWQFVAALLTLVSLVLGVVVYRLQRRRKELGYRVVSQTRVISVEAEVQEEVVIVFKDELVRDVHLVVLDVVNAGNEPIVADDYQCALNIGLGDGARVLTAELVDSEPEGLTAWPVITESPDLVQVHPLLLNPGDWFKLKILVSEFGGRVDVATRIVGVKEVKELGEAPGRARTMITVAAVMLLYGVPMAFALVLGVAAMIEGRWLEMFAWGAAAVVLVLVWTQWGTPMVNRYLRS